MPQHRVSTVVFELAAVAALVLWSPVTTPCARADEPPHREPNAAQKETARTLMDSGDAELARGELRAAYRAYRDADDIMHVPTTAYARGRSEAGLGLLLAAIDSLQRAIHYPVRPQEPRPFTEARRDAAALDRALAERVPTLILELAAAPSGLEVRIDGDLVPATAGVPHRLDPGKHLVHASAPGYRTRDEPVELAEREKRSLALELVREGPDVPDERGVNGAVDGAVDRAADDRAAQGPSSAPGDGARSSGDGGPVMLVLGFGVGGAALVAGAVTGGLSLAGASALAAACPSGTCAAAERGRYDRTLALANASNALLAIGAVGVGVGIAGAVLVAATEPEDAGIALDLGFTHAALRGSF